MRLFPSGRVRAERPRALLSADRRGFRPGSIPNTGTAPIFRTRRDADLTTAIYARLPVLVDRSDGGEVKAWPVKYATMFHMTNDSHLFRTRRELEEREGAYPVIGNRFRSATGEWLPLYEGKMVQAFDHRAASVVVNPQNQHRPAQPAPQRLSSTETRVGCQIHNSGLLPPPFPFPDRIYLCSRFQGCHGTNKIYAP